MTIRPMRFLRNGSGAAGEHNLSTIDLGRLLIILLSVT